MVEAATLAREANAMAQELGEPARYRVRLVASLSALSGSERLRRLDARPTVRSEVVIEVQLSQPRTSFILPLERFRQRRFAMRDAYESRCAHSRAVGDDRAGAHAGGSGGAEGDTANAFLDPPDYCLLGIASFSLAAMAYDGVALELSAPIISQRGAVQGMLCVVLERRFGGGPASDNPAGTMECAPRAIEPMLGRSVHCSVRVQRCWALPPELATLVYGSYAFYTHPITVFPNVLPRDGDEPGAGRVLFEHEATFETTVTDEFIAFLRGDVLAVEIYGHPQFGRPAEAEPDAVPTATYGYLAASVYGRTLLGLSPSDGAAGFSARPLAASPLSSWMDVAAGGPVLTARQCVCDWFDTIDRLLLTVSICELDERGAWTPVELATKSDALGIGGVFQLRQGHSRRLVVRLARVSSCAVRTAGPTLAAGSACRSNGGPTYDGIVAVSVDNIELRTKRDAAPHAAPDGAAERLRIRDWPMSVIDRRIAQLNGQLSELLTAATPRSAHEERAAQLCEEWLALALARAGGSTPGADARTTVASYDLPPLRPPWDEAALEPRVLRAQLAGAEAATPGQDALLLQMIRDPPPAGGSDDAGGDAALCAVCAWDASLHRSVHMVRNTAAGDRVYATVRVTVRTDRQGHLLHLHKRVCLKIVSHKGRLEAIRTALSPANKKRIRSCGVCWHIVTQPLLSAGTAQPPATVAVPQPDRPPTPPSGATLPHAAVPDGTPDNDAATAADAGAHCADAGISTTAVVDEYRRDMATVESILHIERMRQQLRLEERLVHAAHGR